MLLGKNREYLKKLFKPEYLTKCVAVIALSLDEPWKIMSGLDEWIKVLMNLLEEHMKELPLEKQDALKKSSKIKYSRIFLVIHTIKLYDPPVLDEQGKLVVKPRRKTEEEKELKEEIELPEGVLKVNLGIPLIILLTKSDSIIQNERDSFSEQKLEVLYRHLRTTALLYGASIIFCSDKSQINTELFYHYLMNRLYQFPLKFQAISDEKERIFIPSGFDSVTLIK